MNGPDPSHNANWRKSRHSGSQSGECVEVAALDNIVAVRDSKDPSGPTLALQATTWRSILSQLKAR
jgi:hypothetical protein